MGVIPIVNENDSVSYTEIESEDRLFGDNDMLSSVVAVLCRAKKLVILSDIDGFYDSDPRLHPNAKLIEQIDPDRRERLLSGRRRGEAGEAQAGCVPSFRLHSSPLQTYRHHRHQRETPGSSLRHCKGRESRNTVYRENVSRLKSPEAPKRGPAVNWNISDKLPGPLFHLFLWLSVMASPLQAAELSPTQEV